MKRRDQRLGLETFEIGAAERVRADAIAAQRAAKAAAALDQHHALLEPGVEQPVLGRPQERSHSPRPAADDDGRERAFVCQPFSRAHRETP